MTAAQEVALHVTYVRLDRLTPDPRNAKLHNIPAIMDSIKRHGCRVPIVVDDRTELTAGGHGTTEALITLRASKDARTPRHVLTDDDGMWLIPVVRGGASSTDQQASGFNLALNRTQELGGGYHQQDLARQLQDLQGSDLFDELRYSTDEMDALLRRVGDTLDPHDPDGPGAADAPPPIGQDEDAPLDDREPQPDPKPDKVACPACGWTFPLSV